MGGLNKYNDDGGAHAFAIIDRINRVTLAKLDRMERRDAERCRYCGMPTTIDQSDQERPATYCDHEGDAP